MLHSIDIAVIFAYFALTLALGVYFSRRAGRNTEEFFLSGRKLPWWIAGTAMVATTFAADTPLAVTELVARHGIAGNWLWWNMVAGSVLTVFFFARLWRRSGVLTDVEFVELRYSGREAAFLRGFKAVYLGLFMNCVIMGWVNVAMAEILTHIFGVREGVLWWVIACMTVVGVYSLLSGAWGIVMTDFVQFIIAMSGCVALAFVILGLPAVGGVRGLQSALPEATFSFFPAMASAGGAAAGVVALSFGAFLAHVGVQWWASWYPGAEPGGGGYVAQRMMSARDERHSVLAALWFSIANYALRPWPWILVALASLVLYPSLPLDAPAGSSPLGEATRRTGFIWAMRDYLSPGMLGLLVAAFLAAYMSTISTHLNWGTSYLVNDFYRRFVRRGAGEKHYVAVSRLVTMALVAVSSALIFVITSISGAWLFIIECGAGLGLVLILRWYWWRVSAWSEIAAMVTPALAYPAGRILFDGAFPAGFFFTVAVTTAAWIAATCISRPCEMNTLTAFYERVRPGGPGWAPVRSAMGIEGVPEPIAPLAVDWALGIALVYGSLFCIGRLIFGNYFQGLVLLALSAALFFVISRRLAKRMESA